MRAGKKVLAVLTAIALVLGTAVSAMADIEPIPLDMQSHGPKPKADGWIKPKTEYQDESIHVQLFSQRRKSKTSDEAVMVRWVEVEIKDPSQIRTILSAYSFENPAQAYAVDMVRETQPVVAINDDFVKYGNFKGYVVRQGVFYCDTLDEWSEDLKQDVLIIDDQGDFSVVQKATSADMQAFLGELEGQGRKAVNVFTFGPVLVIDGQTQEIKGSDSTHYVAGAAARTAICQLDTLKYVVFAVDGKTGTGMNCRELADFIVSLYPDCRIAYNLDGGGTSNLYMGDSRVNKAAGRRQISGMIYFASAASED